MHTHTHTCAHTPSSTHRLRILHGERGGQLVQQRVGGGTKGGYLAAGGDRDVPGSGQGGEQGKAAAGRAVRAAAAQQAMRAQAHGMLTAATLHIGYSTAATANLAY